MPSARTLSVYAVVVGLVCLPAPLYIAYGIAYTTPDTTEAPFHGPEVDPAEGSPTLLDPGRRFDDARIAAVDTEAGPINVEDAANTTAVLDRAIADGSATTSDSLVRADLRELDARDRFLYADGAYYEFTVTDNGSRVTARPATDATVVRHATDVVDYETLPPATQDAADAIIANTSADGYGDYRPHTSNPVVDREPFLLARGDSVYAIYRDGGTYMGQEFLAVVYGPPISLVGLVLFLGGLVGLFLTRGE